RHLEEGDADRIFFFRGFKAVSKPKFYDRLRPEWPDHRLMASADIGSSRRNDPAEPTFQVSCANDDQSRPGDRRRSATPSACSGDNLGGSADGIQDAVSG